MKPIVVLIAGDVCGIGAELLAKLLQTNEAKNLANHIIISDKRVVHKGMEMAGQSFDYQEVSSLDNLDFSRHHTLLYDTKKIDPDSILIAKENAKAGKAVMEELTIGLDLVQEGKAHSLCFMPINKLAMNLGGFKYEDELAYFDYHLKHNKYYGEINALGNLWTSRVTSHLAFKDIVANITEKAIYEPIKLLYTSLQKAGYNTPKIYVAGLNPHCGDNGLHGDEESTIIAPAIAKANADGYICQGPFPPDTIFVRAQKEAVNGVVTMYHDQGQIAVKLLGFDKGVTIHGGFPVPICTPAHGTAFDIAGKGLADVGASLAAYKIAVNMAKNS